jgi:hypothetical protein
MKIHIIDIDQLSNSGAQCLIMNTLDKAQPNDSELTITKKAYEGEEFYSIAKKLVEQDHELTEYLINRWSLDNAWKSICQYLPKSKYDEACKLVKLYVQCIYIKTSNISQLLKEHGETHNCISGESIVVEKLIRQYYPTLGKRTKKYQVLIEFLRASFFDGHNLYTKANFTFTSIPTDMKVG